MKSPFVHFRLSLVITIACLLTLGLTAQQPPAAPPAPEKPASSETPTAPANPAPATNPAAEPPAERTEPAAEKPATSTVEVSVAHDETGTRVRHHSSGDVPFGDHVIPQGSEAHEAVAILGSTTIDGEVATDAVAILGHTTVGPTGVVHGDAVSVLGGLTLSGAVERDAVSVLGNANINGPVGGDAVCVLGDVTLGPKAVVNGDLVCVLGKVSRHPDAIVRGNHVGLPLLGGWKEMEWATTWVKRCLLLGRPLAFGPNLGWAWGVAFAFLAFYLVLALLFGRGIDRCIETLETRPGGSILASVLTVVATPIVIILLAITIVGALVIPFVGVGLFFANLFGKAVMLAWIGRRLTKFASARPLHPFLAVLIGGVVVMLLYTIWGSFLLYKLLSWLGLGVVVYTLALAMKRDKPPAAVAGVPGGVPPPMPPIVPVSPVASTMAEGSSPAAAPMTSAGFVGGASLPPEVPLVAPIPPSAMAPEPPSSVLPPVPPVPPSVPMPTPIPSASALPFAASAAPVARAAAVAAAVPISAATLPRAGFGIRLAAMLVDVLLVAMVLGFLSHSIPRKLRFDPFPQTMLLMLAVYGAAMWKHKGTTIGGVVCGLKVVRLDQREIDWTTAIVRAVSCFLSLCAAGLGFIWVAFDDEKQSWHDKIAGTTVVRVPKGVSLL